MPPTESDDELLERQQQSERLEATEAQIQVTDQRLTSLPTEGTQVIARDQMGNVISSSQRPEPVTVSHESADGRTLHNFYSNGLTQPHVVTPAQLETQHADGASAFRVIEPTGALEASTTISTMPDGQRLVHSAHPMHGEQTVTVNPQGNVSGFNRSAENVSVLFSANNGNDAVLAVNGRTTATGQLSGIEIQAALVLMSQSVGALSQSAERPITMPRTNLNNNDAATLSNGLVLNAQRALEEFSQSNQIGPQMRNAYLQAEREGKLPAFLQAMNNALQQRNSPFQLQDTTTDRTGTTRSLTMLNAAGPVDTQSFDTVGGAGGPGGDSAVRTGQQELREALRTEPSAFMNATGSREQKTQAREQAISNMSNLLNRTQDVDLNSVLQRMQTVHIVRNLGEATDPASGARHLSELRQQANAGNQSARAVLDWLNTQAGGAAALNQFQRELEQGGNTGSNALGRIHDFTGRDGNPVRALEGTLRVHVITHNIGENPSVDNLRTAERDLQREADNGNTAARGMLRVVSVERMLAGVSRPETATQSMNELAEAARQGNPHARTALASILASANDTSRNVWRQNHSAGEGGERQIPTTNLSHLSSEQAGQIRLSAARTLTELAATTALSRSETTALALAYANSNQRGADGSENDHDRSLRTTIGGAFTNIFSPNGITWENATQQQRNVQVQQVENALRSLANVLTSDTPHGQSVAGWYILGTMSGFNRALSASPLETGRGHDFRSQINQITEAARDGNRGALTVLAAIAGGAGMQNSSANPEVENLSEQRRYVPGDSLARNAQRTLLEMAQQNRQVVIDALTSPAQSLIGDNRLRSETLGRVAAQDPNDISQNVRETLRAGLESASPEGRHSAMRGLLALGASLNNDDLRAIARHPSPESAAAVLSNPQALTAAQSRVILQALRENLPSAAGDQQRSSAMSLMGALARHATPADVSAIAASRPPIADARDALMSIAQQGPHSGVRTAAFNAFASTVTRDDLRNPQVQQRLRDLQRAHAEDLSINLGVARLLHNADRPSTAAIFVERDVPFSDQVTRGLVERATSNYGADTVNRALDRIALFNSLPLDVRRQLSGSSAALSDGQMMDLGGAVLDRNMFNALSPEVRERLSGSRNQLPESHSAWPDLARARIDATNFNALPADLRRALTGSEQQVAAGQSVSLRGRTLDAETFNRLPAHIRESIIGSATALPGGTTLRDFSTVSLTAQEFNSLSEQNRRNVSGRPDAVDTGTALAQMANGTLDATDSRNRFLLGDPPLEQSVRNITQDANAAQRTAEENLQALQRLRSLRLGEFQVSSQEHVGLLNRALSLIGRGTLQSFEQNQVEQLVDMRQLTVRIQESEREVRQATIRSEVMNMSQQTMEHAQLLREGRTAQADQLALQMYTRYGGQLAVSAPQVVQSLIGGGEQSGWARLHRAGLVLTAEPPALEGSSGDTRLASALGLARQIESRNSGGQLFGDAELRRQTALSAINQNEDVRDLMRAFRTVSEHMQVLTVQTQATGTRFEDYIQDAQRREREIRNALQSVSPDQIRNIVQMRDSLRTAIAAQGQGAINDPEMRRQLQEQLGSLNAALQFFNPSEPNAVAPGRAQEVQQRLSQLDPLLQRVYTIPRSELIREFNMRVAYPGEPEAHMVHRYVSQWRNEQAQLRAEQAFINGGNGYQRLHNMLDIVHRDGFQSDTFRNWVVNEGPSVAAGIAVGAVFAVATGGTSLLAMGVGTAGYFLGSGAAREFQFQFGLRESGSNWGEYMRGTPVRDQFGNLRPREYLRDVAGPFVLDVTIGTLSGYAAAGLGSFIGTGLRGAFSRMSATARDAFVRENGPAIAQLTNNLARLESAATTPAQQQMARQLLGRMLQDSSFMGIQTAGEEALSHRLGNALGESNHVLSFVVATVLSAGHSGLSVQARPRTSPVHGGPNQPHAVMEFHGSAAQERQFFREAELRGSTLTRTQDGRYLEVTPEGFRIEYTRIGRGAGTPPLAMHPEGHPLALQPRTDLPSEVSVGTNSWRRGAAQHEMQIELARFSEHFLRTNGGAQPDFSEALRIAQSTEGFPQNLRVTNHDVSLDLASFRSASASARETMLRDMMSQMAANSHAPTSLQGNPELVVARPTVVVDGVRVDLATLQALPATGSGAHAPERVTGAIEQVRQFRNSPEGQRLIAEQAIVRMEERLHIRQLQTGNQVFTPGYARFLADQPNGNESLADPSSRSRASLEQELIFAMHDAGWSIEHLRHHFGNHHSSVREPVFAYLQAQQALASIPSLSAQQRSDMTTALGRTTPETQRTILNRLAEISSQSLSPANLQRELTQLQLQARRNPSAELMQQWFEHEAANIQLEPEERQRLEEARAQGLFEYRILDYDFMHSHVMASREADRRVSSYHAIGSADRYDPMHPGNRPVYVVYDPVTEHYHVMNGNNRTYLFGDRPTNPNNLGLPVWFFATPEAYERAMGVSLDRHHSYPFRWRQD